MPRARGGLGAPVKKADRERWFHEGRCGRCRPITLRSGDVLLFDGNPDTGVAHGVQRTVAGTAPRGRIDLAQTVDVESLATLSESNGDDTPRGTRSQEGSHHGRRRGS